MGNKSLALVLLLTIAFSSMLTVKNLNAQLAPNQAEDSWIKVASYPPTYYGVQSAVAFNGSIYALAGIDTGQTIFKRYDSGTDTWIPVTTPNSWGSLVVCQNKIYLIGNREIPKVYDPSTDRWENKSAMPQSFYAQRANVVDDKIYLISGLYPAAYGVWDPAQETYVYDTANDSWSTMAPIPTPVGAYSSAVLDGKIYIIGGGPTTDYQNPNATTLVQIFDPKTNEWILGPAMPIGVINAGSCSTSGYYAPKRIYVVGGNTWYSAGRSANYMNGTNFTQVYDTQTGKWSLATPALDNFPSLTLINVNDALYAIRYGKIDATEKYIPTGYKASLLPTNTPNSSPSSTDSPVSGQPFPTIEVVIISALTAVAIASLVLFRKHQKTAKPS